ncbi:uncharacterized protein KY384_008060 [Bacidia gigantensis]|uniref:uncharacterized protein n=1 Tax=Bacidia gigantensis TaxID=2732470 RepID=UPI001D04D569|nr:uncharacterized protein KY384_008060 [Bacidia gigantensis]KAG8527316.1 hypothetical protein KY384_008060 [Bacidia gigantensis]
MDALAGVMILEYRQITAHEAQQKGFDDRFPSSSIEKDHTTSLHLLFRQSIFSAMKYLSCALFASVAIAGPLLSRAPPNSDVVSRCENAVNCETYHDDNGKLKVRFKEGQEPGTDAYNQLHKFRKVKRDGASTSVTLSDSTIWWGCDIDVIQTLDHIGDICKTSGSCVTSEPWTTDVKYVDPGDVQPESDVLKISATGHYPPWLRNGIVEAVKATYSADGVIDSQTTEYSAITGPSDYMGGPKVSMQQCKTSKAPQEIDIGFFSAPNIMEATIQVIVTVEQVENGFCSKGLPLAAAVTSAFGAWGAGIAAIFGTVSATCGL